jgi:hypothetical protein
MKLVGNTFEDMIKSLISDPEGGPLQISPFVGTRRTDNNTLLVVLYFKSTAYCVKWAREGLHKL